MDRREVIAGTFGGLLLPLFAQAAARSGPGVAAKPAIAFDFTRIEDPQEIASAYQLHTKGGNSASVPHIYAHFDPALEGGKFVNPLAVKPILKADSYHLTTSLRAFNVAREQGMKFRSQKQQLLLALNASTSTKSFGRLSWVFMNALKVGLAEGDSRAAAMQDFFKDNGPSAPTLKATPGVVVQGGQVGLQLSALATHEEGFWSHLWDNFFKDSNSTTVSALAAGASVPALAVEALGFVTHALNVLAHGENNEPLWSTGTLDFAVSPDVDAVFKMKPGIWLTVDRTYAQRTNFLAGHTLDLEYQSLRLLDAHKVPVDTNYLVSELNFSRVSGSADSSNSDDSSEG
jgi:hypothetical protein